MTWTTPTAQPETTEGSNVLLRDFFRALFARKTSIAVITLVVMGAMAFTVFWLIVPTFESKARIHVDLQAGAMPVLRNATPFVSDTEKLALFETVIQEIKSKPILSAVVDELHLTTTRKIGNIERIKILYVRLRGYLGAWLGIRSWQKAYDYRAAALAALDRNLQVNRLENSTVLELVYEAKDAEECRATLDAVLRHYIAYRTAFTRDKAQGGSSFLATEIQRVRREINELEESWRRLVAADRYRLPVAPANDAASTSQRTELEVSGMGTDERVVGELKLHIIAMQEELNKLDALYTGQHPRAQELRTMLRSYQAVVNDAPEKLMQLRRISREIAAKEAVYKDLLVAYENAISLESRELARLNIIKVIQPPDLPGDRKRPKRLLAMAASLVLGLLLGAMYALVADFFDTTVKTPEDVRHRLGARYLGSLPKV